MNEVLVNKIRKILSKTSEAGCTEEEANSAFALANKLMMEHNITMMQVKTSEQGEPQVFGDAKVIEYGKWTLDISLANDVCNKYFFVKAITFGKFGRRRTLMFFGTKENSITAKYVFDGLLLAFDNLWNQYQLKYRSPAKYRRVFIIGVQEGFMHKLAEERKSLVKELDHQKGSTGTELVLVSIMNQTLTKYDEIHPNTKTAKCVTMTYTRNETAQSAGFSAGKNLNINRPLAAANTNRKGIS